jgi:hypothetical protein
MRNSLLPLAFWCVLIASCGIRNSKVVLDPYYRNTSKSEAENQEVTTHQQASNSLECYLNFMGNECPQEENRNQSTLNAEKFNPARISKVSKNHLLDPQESSKIKSHHSNLQKEFIDYEGNNYAMEYGFKMFVYGLLSTLLIIGIGYVFSSIGFIGFIFFILSLLVSIIGLLMWFFGWLFS